VIRTDEFQYNWKEFFVNGSDLVEDKKNYFYENKNNEQDPILWGYNAIWYGRATQQFKQIPKNIKEDPELVIKSKITDIKQVLSP